MNIMKKFYPLFLMLLLYSAAAFTQTYSGGSGTEGDPYQIANATDLIYLSNHSTDWAKYFIQTADITFDANEENVDWDGDGSSDGAGTSGFAGIGNSTSMYTGTYDGQGYKVANLYMYYPDDDATEGVGLFAYCKGSIIKNLGIEDAYIYGNERVAMLIGVLEGECYVDNCYAKGVVYGNTRAAGLIGSDTFSSPKAHIHATNSYTEVDLALWDATYAGASRYLGGFMGSLSYHATISNCYATGTIDNSLITDVSNTDLRRVGGFIGATYGKYDGDVVITDCYAIVDINGLEDAAGTYGSGFYGYMLIQATGGSSLSISNCYSAGNRGFIRYYLTSYSASATDTIFSNNFYDISATVNDSTKYGKSGTIAKTTAEMQTRSTFTNAAWDFNTVWSMAAAYNSGYPNLSGEGESFSWEGTVDTDWNTAGNWSGGYVPAQNDDVSIPAAATIVIASDASAYCGDLAVASGGSLTIQSDASNTGSLIINGTSSGDVTAQRYMTGDGSTWHLTGVPVVGQDINGFITTAGNSFATNAAMYGVGFYVEESDSWTTFTDASFGNLTPGQGYEANRSANGVVSFEGALSVDQVDVAIVRTGNGWNLLGNPYPCALNANSAADANNNFLDLNTALMDESYVGLYFWNPTTSSYNVVNNASAATYIPSGQAFFVKSAAGGGTASFTTNMRTHQTGAAFKSGTANPNIILKADNGESTRSTEFRFVEGTTFGLDPGYDAGLFNGKTDEFKLCSRLMQDNGIGFALQCLPTDDFESVIIPIELNSVTSTVEFSVETSSLPANTKVYLEDKENNSFNLLNGIQTYTAQVNVGENTDRFYLHTSQQALDQMAELTEGKNEIIPQMQSSSLLIQGEIPEGSFISIIDLTGRVVFETNVSSTNVIIPSLNNGVYIVKLSNGQTTYSQKINWIK